MSESRVPTSTEIRGVFLPVADRQILLPNAAVAELIGYQEPEEDPAAPDWFLGHIPWRGKRIPLVSLERAVGRPDAVSQSKRVRIAVLNTLNGNADLPYIGLLSTGVARLARINAKTLAQDPEDDLESPLVLESVRVDEVRAWIPDLDELEKLVAGFCASDETV